MTHSSPANADTVQSHAAWLADGLEGPGWRDYVGMATTELRRIATAPLPSPTNTVLADWLAHYATCFIDDERVGRRMLEIVECLRSRVRSQQTASPANETTEGYTEAEGYAASLRQQADLMEKANAGKVSAYVAIDDFDVDELREAADFIERISAQCVPISLEFFLTLRHAFGNAGRPGSDIQDGPFADYVLRMLATDPSFTSPKCGDGA